MGRGRPRKIVPANDHQKPLQRLQEEQSYLGQNVQFQCNYCEKDISDLVRMKCHVCPNFNLCVECSSVGAEVWPHKSDHPYRVMNKLSFPLISPDWSADQELLLLEGLDNFGFCNWAKVAEHIKTKSEQECAEHYNTCYLGAPNFIPEMKEANKSIAMTKGQGTSSSRRRSERLRLLRSKDGSSSKKPENTKIDEGHQEIEKQCQEMGVSTEYHTRMQALMAQLTSMGKIAEGPENLKIDEELQEIEKQLCQEMGVSTGYYTRMQELMATLISMGRIAKKSDAHEIFETVEPSKVDRVYDILVMKGTVPSS